MRLLKFSLFLSILSPLQAQDIFTIYSGTGERLSIAQLSEHSQAKKVILFGELHNQPVLHWLQLQMVKKLPAGSALGLEMLDIDNRQLVTDYNKDIANGRHLKQAMAGWQNFSTDYLPIAKAAREHKLKLFASNAPTRLVSYTAKAGLKGLYDLANAHPQLKFPLPEQEDMTNELYSKLAKEMPAGHGGTGIIAAQALRDACMAHSIFAEISQSKQVMHIHGGYHSKNRQGISFYLRKMDFPADQIFHIQSVLSKKCATLDESILNAADATVCLSEDNITSY